MENKLKIAIEALQTISRIGDRLSHIECSSSIYSLDDDEFGDIMFMRDLADEALMKLKDSSDGM